MRLWSWHTPDFSLTDGHVDSTKNEYGETVPTLRPAYEELWKLLGTRDVVWCYTCRYRYFLRPDREMVAWVIAAPDSEILKFVDGELWSEYVHGHLNPQSPEFSAIFIDRPECEIDCAIIRHPVPASWIVDCQSYVGEGNRVLPPD